MKSIKIIFIMAIASFISCKSHKETAEATPPAPVTNDAPKGNAIVTSDAKSETLITNPGDAKQTSDDFVYRLIVSFISIGEGTDPAARETMDSFLKEYQASNGKAIHYQPVPWGREGEADFCFPLIELNPKEQIVFINDLKERFKNRPLVQFTENEACRHKR